MDATYRRDLLADVHPGFRERCTLADLDREYTLGEICTITRAGPARILGLTHKGHLGPGADADVTIYSPHENKEVMFSLPRYVIKAGEVVVDDTEIRSTPVGESLYVAPEFDPGAVDHIRDWFEKYYSVRFRNYPVSDEYLRFPRRML